MKIKQTKKINKLTGGSPSSFCHIAELEGFESTSHFRDTGIPSRNGYPKPGVRVMAKDGVSEVEKKRENKSLFKMRLLRPI
jgi:hypothetical protein